MPVHTYLSLIPESLVISMLEPEQFGNYLAAGTQKRSREQAIYFDLKDFASDYFDFESARKMCVAHPDGTVKRTVYVSIYRVLEHVPLPSLGSMWLCTRDGRVLRLEQGEAEKRFEGKYHLYQELCPVHPLIASSLNPAEFCKFITDRSERISVPQVCFADMELASLADDPSSQDYCDLPYSNMEHLQFCLSQLASGEKRIKTVNRVAPERVHFRVVKSGFYIGSGDELIFYPFPSDSELEREHHDWWRSATL